MRGQVLPCCLKAEKAFNYLHNAQQGLSKLHSNLEGCTLLFRFGSQLDKQAATLLHTSEGGQNKRPLFKHLRWITNAFRGKSNLEKADGF